MIDDSLSGSKLPHQSKTILVMTAIAAATPVIWPLLPPALQDPKYSHAAICFAGIFLRIFSNEKIIWYGSQNAKN